MSNLFLFHPLRIGSQGGVAVTDDPDQHLKDKIEAALYTNPGERVNRDFGVGLRRYVFEGIDELTLTALEFRISQALKRDVGDDLIFDSVSFTTRPEGGELGLLIEYRRRSDRIPRLMEVEL